MAQLYRACRRSARRQSCTRKMQYRSLPSNATAHLAALASGRAFEHEILYRRGSADGDVGQEEVRRKFAGNVGRLLSDADRDRVVQLVEVLDTAAHVRELCDILANRVRTTVD